MFNVRDQVIVKEQTRLSGPLTKEIKVASVMAVSQDGKTLEVSIPRPGGMAMRKTVSAADCEPVSDAFRRSSVQINPAFRQLYMGPV